VIPNAIGSAALPFYSVPLGELPPPAPRDCFGRDKLIEEAVGLVKILEPIALISPGGIGKTSIALTVLNTIESNKGSSKEALSIFERTNDALRQANYQIYIANVLCEDGQLDAAEDTASRAIDLLSEKHHEFIVCQLHRVLGEIHRPKRERR
jgi:hypothetical protein